MTQSCDRRWTIRAYEERDEAQALALFAQVFGRPLAPVVWRWKVGPRSSPAAARWVATDGARLIALHAGMPIRLKLGSGLREAMVSVDAMTTPDRRRSGVHRALLSAVYEAWTAAGLALSLALPNEQVRSLIAMLGWVTVTPLPWLRAPLHIEHALARRARLPRRLERPFLRAVGAATAAWHRRRRPADPRVALSEARHDLADLDRLWMAVAGHYENAVVRDAAWIRWRYLEAPDFGYRVLLAHEGGQPAGYVAYRAVEAPGRTTGIIADLLTAPAATRVARALLAAALDDLWSRGAETARAVALPGSPLHGALRDAGFMPAPGAFDFRLLALDTSLPLDRLRDPARWLLSGGDFDVA